MPKYSQFFDKSSFDLFDLIFLPRDWKPAFRLNIIDRWKQSRLRPKANPDESLSMVVSQRRNQFQLHRIHARRYFPSRETSLRTLSRRP